MSCHDVMVIESTAMSCHDVIVIESAAMSCHDVGFVIESRACDCQLGAYHVC